jgi:hydrogenase-4 component B
MISVVFNSFLTVLLFIPAMTLVSHWWKSARLISSIVLLLGLLTGAALAAKCWWWGIQPAVDLSGWAPLPFTLTIDRLSAFFLFLVCSVGAPVILFAISYIERHYEGLRRAWLWGLLPWFLLSMVIVVTASSGFAFLFGWELMTLVSAGLVLIDGDSEERRHNLFIYLLMMHAGAAAVFAAFMLFLPHAAGLSFAAIRGSTTMMSPAMRNAIFLMAFLGFGTKAGIVPLHLWLPKAHPIAPSPVSALMSAIMLKTAVYGLVRFTFDFLGTGPSWWGYLILITGALSGVLGVLYALAENDLKRLLAYSSVENIGIIYLGIGASLIFAAEHAAAWAALALCAALLHTWNHAHFKSLLFLGAGAVSDTAHTLNLEELGGLLRRMPTIGTASLVGCCSIIGLPLFNGFVSEWLTFRAFVAGAMLTSLPAVIVLPLMIGVLAMIGGVAAAVFAKLFGVAFLGRARSESAETARAGSTAMKAAMASLAAGCVLIGIWPGLLLAPLSLIGQELLGAGLPISEIAPLIHALPWLALGILTFLVAVTIAQRVPRLTSTWACGLPELDSRMEYTGTAFSKPLRRVLAQVYRPDRTVEVLPANNRFFPTSISYRSVRTTSFERALYRPTVEAIVSIGHRLRRLQTGNIQVYLLYVFLALVGALIFMRFA